MYVRMYVYVAAQKGPFLLEQSFVYKLVWSDMSVWGRRTACADRQWAVVRAEGGVGQCTAHAWPTLHCSLHIHVHARTCT